MVKFIEDKSDKNDDDNISKWRRMMQTTRDKFREIWGDTSGLPDRDKE